MIAILATITATIFAIPLGTIAALKQDTWIDYVVRIISIAGIATPSFWFGILIIFAILFTTQWWSGVPWMPPIEYKSDWATWANVKNNLSLLIWPALATGYRYSAVATRMTRSAMLEVLREDYIRTARAKGAGRTAHRRPSCAQERDAAGGHRHRHRIRLPDGRSGRHRTGVQSQRPRQAVRRIGAQLRLHHDPGSGDAGRRRCSCSPTSWSTSSMRGSTHASAIAERACRWLSSPKSRPRPSSRNWPSKSHRLGRARADAPQAAGRGRRHHRRGR